MWVDELLSAFWIESWSCHPCFSCSEMKKNPSWMIQRSWISFWCRTSCWSCLSCFCCLCESSRNCAWLNQRHSWCRIYRSVFSEKWLSSGLRSAPLGAMGQAPLRGIPQGRGSPRISKLLRQETETRGQATGFSCVLKKESLVSGSELSRGRVPGREPLRDSAKVGLRQGVG